MADSALQRKNMVESQVRPSDVTDRRIMAAMQTLPRERFLPLELAPLAYMDEVLPLGRGRAMMAPRTLARLVQLARIEDGQKVLDVGCLSGYSAAVLAHLGARVVALESDTKLADGARAILKDLAIANVEIVTGALSEGYAPAAPYGVIIANGAIERLPQALLDQLAPTGRLVAIEIDDDGVGRAVTFQMAGGHNAAGSAVRRVAFDASAPPLPGFERPPAFKF